MLDALLPAAAAFEGAVGSGRSRADALRSAADAAAAGVRATAKMVPRRGRSSYLGERALGHPDPGAEAVAVVLDALARG
jgi:dihydroxyacetone kinase